MRTKKLPSSKRRERPVFCRYVFDSKLGLVLTDQSPADFVV